LTLDIVDYEDRLLAKVLKGHTQVEMFALRKQFEDLIKGHQRH
jgi:hypothetical protein